MAGGEVSLVRGDAGGVGDEWRGDREEGGGEGVDVGALVEGV